jgi:hypothetical protein
MKTDNNMAEYGFDEIHIFESLPESDGNPGRQLTERWNANPLKGIKCHYHFVLDKADLDRDLAAVTSQIPNCVPLLHFEVHGNDEGFGLRDKTFVRWDDFGKQLAPINRASGFHLLVVWSCCFGIHQIAAMSAFKPAPFVAVLGCDRKAYTDELLAGFTAFYPALVSTGKAEQALQALQAKIASGAKFDLFTAASAFRGTYKIVRQQTSDPAALPERRKRIREQLQQEATRRGVGAPVVTDSQIDQTLRLTELPTLRQFHEAFFACEELPANRTRFPFDQLTEGLI